MKVHVKRIYDKPSRNDGQRILVDRVWPRGVKKQDADLDGWMKEIAPSTGLRKWFGHDPAKWAKFKARYHQELKHKTALVRELHYKAEQKTVTLLYAARDDEHNNAVALKEYLDSNS